VFISKKIHNMIHEFVIMHMMEEVIINVNMIRFVLIKFCQIANLVFQRMWWRWGYRWVFYRADGDLLRFT